MLPRKRRIPSLWFKGRYRRITLQKGLHVLVSVFEAPEDNSPTRFACVVSKKGINAPTRNSIRRRAYAIIEELLPNIRNGLYCTLSLSKDVADMSHDALRDEIIDLFRKSSVM
jgi:ribonuclease P protein component